MLYGFRPRMFVVTTLFESQNYIYKLKLNFVLKLCYYSIHHLASFNIAVNSAVVHAMLSVGSDTVPL